MSTTTLSISNILQHNFAVRFYFHCCSPWIRAWLRAIDIQQPCSKSLCLVPVLSISATSPRSLSNNWRNVPSNTYSPQMIFIKKIFNFNWRKAVLEKRADPAGFDATFISYGFVYNLWCFRNESLLVQPSGTFALQCLTRYILKLGSASSHVMY